MTVWQIFEKYKSENTDDKGAQKSNMTPAETNGMRKIMKRVKDMLQSQFKCSHFNHVIKNSNWFLKKSQ